MKISSESFRHDNTEEEGKLEEKVIFLLSSTLSKTLSDCEDAMSLRCFFCSFILFASSAIFLADSVNCVATRKAMFIRSGDTDNCIDGRLTSITTGEYFSASRGDNT